MGRSPYGRPYRRRKTVRLIGQPPCSICGQRILRPRDGTLHHTVPVAEGGDAFSEQPAHKSCNASHGGKLGAQRRGRRRVDDDELDAEFDRPAPRRGARPSSRYPRVWEGAVAVELVGPVEVHRADGTIVRVERGELYSS
jgi:hypothetical protein